MRRSSLLQIGLGLLVLLAAAFITLTPAQAAAPSNDDFGSAVAITSLPFSDSRDISEATRASDDPFCGYETGSVWYRYTATTSEALAIRTAGSSYTTLIGVYTGARGSLREVTTCVSRGAESSEPVRFNAIAGTTYYLLVGGVAGAYPAGFTLNFSLTVVPDAISNDEPETATAITALPFSETIATATATAAPSDPRCDYADSRTIWYTLTPATRTPVRFSVDGWGVDKIAVYRGQPAGLNELGCAGRDSSGITTLNVELEAGQRYYLMVGLFSHIQENTVTVSAEVIADAPAHDRADSPRVVPSLPFTDTLDFSRATIAADEISCGKRQPSLWYTLTPASDMQLLITVAGFPSAQIQVIKATDGTIFDPCNTSGEQLVNASANQTYLIRVSGNESINGPYELRINQLAPNDEPAGATAISALPYRVEQNTGDATESYYDPSPVSGSSVWYAFTPTTTQYLAASTFGSDYATILAAYTGAFPYATQQIAVNYNAQGTSQSRIVFKAEAGKTYSFGIGDQQLGRGGNLVFTLDAVQPPANTTSDRATVITSLPFQVRQDTRNAGQEPGGNGNCRVPGGAVWYTYTPSSATLIRFDPLGSSYPLLMAVYTAPPSEQTAVACAASTSLTPFTFEAAAGQIYYIKIQGYGTDGGDLNLSLTGEPLLPIKPSLDCVAKTDTGYLAYFGYRNDNSFARQIWVGPRNFFSPGDQWRGQTNYFAPGRYERVFSVPFDGSNLTWTVDGRSETASKNSPRCQQ